MPSSAPRLSRGVSGLYRSDGDDLTEGLNDWQPVQEIVRLTFKALHDVVKAQGETLKNVEKTLGHKVSKPDLTTSLSEKVNINELRHTFEELSQVIDAKADAQD